LKEKLNLYDHEEYKQKLKAIADDFINNGSQDEDKILVGDVLISEALRGELLSDINLDDLWKPLKYVFKPPQIISTYLKINLHWNWNLLNNFEKKVDKTCGGIYILGLKKLFLQGLEKIREEGCKDPMKVHIVTGGTSRGGNHAEQEPICRKVIRKFLKSLRIEKSLEWIANEGCAVVSFEKIKEVVQDDHKFLDAAQKALGKD